MSIRSGPSDVDRVREATDLVALIGEHIALTPRGREHVGICPFHEDHSPSLAVVTHKGNAFYKCHACGAAGDAFNFVMAYQRKEFAEALAYLADRAGISLDRDHRATVRSGPGREGIRRANTAAASFYQRLLRDPTAGAAARQILAERGISDTTIERFGLGFAPPGFSNLRSTLQDHEAETTAEAAGLLKPGRDGSRYDTFRNRLIFPIHDEMGLPIAFGARRVDPADQPKYLNSSESAIFQKSRTLYGLHLAKRAIIDSGQAIVVEGYTDVLACHQAGIENAVATLGTALTSDHARLLSRLCQAVVLLFDGDEAGQRAADRGVELFFKHPVDIKICVLPPGIDPDELLRQDDGPELFHQAIAESRDALEYKLDRFERQLVDQSTLAGREQLLERFLAELADVGFAALQGVRKRWLMTRLSDLVGVPMADIQQMMPRSRNRAEPAPRSASASPIAGADLLRPMATVSRARRVAERDLLAVLIFESSAAAKPVELEDGRCIDAATAFDPESFLDPIARAIGERVFARLRSGETLTVTALLGELSDECHREVASSLHFEGERRCGTDGEHGREALRDAVAALTSRMTEDAYHRRVADGRRVTPEADQVAALHELLERRRECGDIAAAIVQDVRT